jgi:hypothetical protein
MFADKYEWRWPKEFRILSLVRGSVTNNNGFWIALFDWLTSSLQLLLIKINYNSTQNHNQLLPKTRSIPYWTSVLPSGSDLWVGHLLTCVVRWLILHSWTLNTVQLLNWITELLSEFSYDWTVKLTQLQSESESHVTTDSQSASLSWKKAPIWGFRPDIY